MIDDSALFHARANYDPVKAKEYYERTKKLKGRRKGSQLLPSRPRSSSKALVTRGPSGKPNRSDAKSRRAQLKAQQERLEKRLATLKEALRELVDAAQSRNDKNSSEKDKAPETKADRNSAKKGDKPLSQSEKSEKAKKAKEAYEKENPNTLSKDVEILKEQIKDIEAKIKKAMAESNARAPKRPEGSVLTAGPGSSKGMPKSKKNSQDGPKGR